MTYIRRPIRCGIESIRSMREHGDSEDVLNFNIVLCSCGFDFVGIIVGLRGSWVNVFRIEVL